jgi:hypothetical protein
MLLFVMGHAMECIILGLLAALKIGFPTINPILNQVLE